MRIGIDIDGVLARFDQGYARLIMRETGWFIDIENPNWPAEWYWDRALFKAKGLNPQAAKQLENTIWDRDIKPTTFWGTLGEYAGTIQALDRLRLSVYAGYDIYFITSRPGHLAKFYTEMWLSLHGMLNPTVLIAHDKGPVISGLELDVFIDDKPENIVAAVEARPKVRAYLIDRPYNHHPAVLEGVDHIRVADIGTVLTIELGDMKEKAA